jgi:hypothetical protein
VRFWKGFLLVMLVIAGIILLLPYHREFRIYDSKVIERDAKAIFPYLNSFRRFNEWSDWAARDPQTEFVFSGPEDGVGAKMAWRSNDDQIGKGHLEIIESRPDQTIVIALAVPPKKEARLTYKLISSGSRTMVEWSIESSQDANLFRYLTGGMLDETDAGHFPGDLERLKRKVEASPS